MLAMGGSALGEAVKSSGLLSAIAHGIQDLIVDRGIWAVLAIFCALVLVATTFISHTVGAMVILPIVQAVGADMSVRLHSLVPQKSLLPSHSSPSPEPCMHHSTVWARAPWVLQPGEHARVARPIVQSGGKDCLRLLLPAWSGSYSLAMQRGIAPAMRVWARQTKEQ